MTLGQGRCEVFGREVRSRASLLREPVPDEPNAVKAASTVLQNKGTEPIVLYGYLAPCPSLAGAFFPSRQLAHFRFGLSGETPISNVPAGLGTQH